jgi:hypothetical protein
MVIAAWRTGLDIGGVVLTKPFRPEELARLLAQRQEAVQTGVRSKDKAPFHLLRTARCVLRPGGTTCLTMAFPAAIVCLLTIQGSRQGTLT